MTNTKERLLAAINTVTPLDDYVKSDCIFSQKYSFDASMMVYILLRLSTAFHFTITDDFVDALENITFAGLEELLEQYSNTAA